MISQVWDRIGIDSRGLIISGLRGHWFHISNLLGHPVVPSQKNTLEKYQRSQNPISSSLSWVRIWPGAKKMLDELKKVFKITLNFYFSMKIRVPVKKCIWLCFEYRYLKIVFLDLIFLRMVRFDNKIWILDLLFSGIMVFQRSVKRKIGRGY